MRAADKSISQAPSFSSLRIGGRVVLGTHQTHQRLRLSVQSLKTLFPDPAALEAFLLKLAGNVPLYARGDGLKPVGEAPLDEGFWRTLLADKQVEVSSGGSLVGGDFFSGVGLTVTEEDVSPSMLRLEDLLERLEKILRTNLPALSPTLWPLSSDDPSHYPVHLPVALRSLYRQYRRRRDPQENSELLQGLSYFVPPSGNVKDRDWTGHFSMVDRLQALSQWDDYGNYVLIQGESGSGKSILLNWLEDRLWERFGEVGDARIVPILIELKAVSVGVNEVVADYLRRCCHYPEELVWELQQRYGVAFLLDGLDEKPGADQNLWVTNQLSDWRGTLLVTCRTSYLDQLRRQREDWEAHYFSYLGRERRVYASKYYLLPFNTDQVLDYIYKYVQSKEGQAIWQGNFQACYEDLKSVPGLEALISSPLLLRMIVSVLKQLKQRSERSDQPLVKWDIYEAFMSGWFDREVMRRSSPTTSATEQVSQKASFREFAERLAFKMFCFHPKGKAVVSVAYWTPEERKAYVEAQALARQQKARAQASDDILSALGIDEAFIHPDGEDQVEPMLPVPLEEPESVDHWLGRLSEWDAYFHDASNAQALSSCPLRTSQGVYSFYHKSFLEYFAASRLLWALHLLEEASPTVYKLAFIDLIAAVKQEQAPVDDEFGPWVFNVKSLWEEPGILRFMVEQLGRDEGRRVDFLVNVVLLSRGLKGVGGYDGKRLGTAASNAMMCLSRLPGGLALSGKRFNGVSIPGANLDHSILVGCSFRDAHLDSVSLVGMWANDVDFRGANFSRVHFGELPSLVQTKSFEAIACHPSRPWVAIARINSGDIRVQTFTGEEVIVLSGHTVWVRSVAWHADGRLASGSEDCTVRVWRTEGGWLTGDSQELRGHTDFVTSVAWHADGRLASGSYDKTVRVWSMKGGQWMIEPQVLRGHTHFVYSVAWHADGRLASGSEDKTIQVWQTEGGRLTGDSQELRGHTSEVSSVAWHANGRLASVSYHDETVRVWSMKGGQWMIEPQLLRGHTHHIYSVAWHADGRLASGGIDRIVRVWLAEGGQLTGASHELHGHISAVTSVAWHADGRLLSGSDDGTVRVWLTQARQLTSASQVLRGHTHYVYSVAWHADGRLASGSEDQTVRVWLTQAGQLTGASQVCKYSKEVSRFAWHADGRLASLGHEDKTIRVWLTEDGQLTGASQELRGHIYAVTSVAWHADGRLVSGSKDGTIRVWLVEGGQLTGTSQVLCRHNASVKSIAWHADGRLASSWGKKVQVSLTVDGQLTGTSQKLRGHNSTVFSVAWHVDGRLASGGWDSTVRVWLVEGGQLTGASHELRGHTDPVTSVAWHSDGRLASGSWDCTVRLWDPTRASCLQVISVCFYVHSIAFNSQGQLAVAALNTVQVWALSPLRLCFIRGEVGGFPLTLTDARVDQASGLSALNQRLLSQRGALGTPLPPPPETDLNVLIDRALRNGYVFCVNRPSREQLTIQCTTQSAEISTDASMLTELTSALEQVVKGIHLDTNDQIVTITGSANALDACIACLKDASGGSLISLVLKRHNLFSSTHTTEERSGSASEKSNAELCCRQM